MVVVLRTLAFRLAGHLIRFAIDRSLKAALPKIFARLDVELPYYYRHKEPPAPMLVQGMIGGAIADAIGEKATPEQMQLVRLLYDPVEAARHALMLRSRP